MSNKFFRYGEDHLSIGKVIALAEGKLTGILDTPSRQQIQASSGYVDEMVQHHEVVYGINTGFGPLCDTIISPEDTSKLQHNLLKSHAVGIGNPIPADVAKMMLIIKVHALARGYSGIRITTLERILWMIQHHVIPVVPEKGSVGASGDLALLSHLFLPLIGLGEVYYLGERCAAGRMLQQEHLEPLSLGPKEGLALINGTQFIAAFAVKALCRLHNALDTADLAGALSLEGLMGSYRPFDPRLHTIRPFAGNQLVAYRLWHLLQPSEIANSHPDCGRVQDPYSLRCMPQVHGASRTAWQHLRDLTEIEINSVTDNPIILDSHDSISGGNFHGQPLALPIDYATVAAAELGNIADRRCYLIIEGRYGLPKLLIRDAGLNSGFMIPQYTTAALVSENKNLCFPASADSIPTSLGQEDHVSMGSIGARKLNQVIDNLEFIQAIELLYAAQALDFRRPLKTSPVLEACYSHIRRAVSFSTEDRVFSTDINALHQLVSSGSFVNIADTKASEISLNLNGPYDESFSLY